MTREIPVGDTMVAIVDDGDYETITLFKWSPLHNQKKHHTTIYAQTWVEGNQMYMHRLIMAAGPGQRVDHRDHDGLNNRRENLRFATNAQNIRSSIKHMPGSSRYKGVCWIKSGQRRARWRATINPDGIQKTLGHYYSEEDAARAYNEAAREIFGEYAVLNVIP